MFRLQLTTEEILPSAISSSLHAVGSTMEKAYLKNYARKRGASRVADVPKTKLYTRKRINSIISLRRLPLNEAEEYLLRISI